MNAPFPQDARPAVREPLRLLIAAPRGFCAGVDRAIEIVERAIERYGAPVYVRHEIVHNRYVVDGLKAKGAVFVEELDEVPDGAPVIFSAHGCRNRVRRTAARAGRIGSTRPARWSARCIARPNARSRPGGISCSSVTPAIPK